MPAVLPRELPLCEPARRGGRAPRAGRGATWVGTRYLGCELQARGPGHRQRYLLTASDSWSPGAIHARTPASRQTAHHGAEPPIRLVVGRCVVDYYRAIHRRRSRTGNFTPSDTTRHQHELRTPPFHATFAPASVAELSGCTLLQSAERFQRLHSPPEPPPRGPSIPRIRPAMPPMAPAASPRMTP